MSLRIVTFNILAQAYIKPGRYPHSKPQALDPEARRRLLISTLRELDADVYALQEVEVDAFEDILQELGPDDYHGLFEQRHGKPDGAALFSRKACLRVLESHSLHYQAHEPKDDQCAVIQVFEAEGQKLAVASTHLRWQPQSKSRREHLGRRQLIELLDASQSIGPEAAWVLAGDFNANSQSVVLQAALERDWALSCRSQRPWDTTNINGRRRKLDYLLFKPEMLCAKPGSLPRLETDTPMPSEQYASDHLPVTVDVTFA